MDPSSAQFWLFVFTQIFILVGLFGLIIPVFPGIVIIWLATLGYGILAGFGTIGVILFILQTLLMIAGVTVDNFLMGVGARQGGASWKTIAAALVAGVVGTLLVPPVGGIIAAPAAVLLLEYQRVRDRDQAWRALLGLAKGWGLSFVVRFLIGLAMMGVWWLWVLWG